MANESRRAQSPTGECHLGLSNGSRLACDSVPDRSPISVIWLRPTTNIAPQITAKSPSPTPQLHAELSIVSARPDGAMKWSMQLPRYMVQEDVRFTQWSN